MSEKSTLDLDGYAKFLEENEVKNSTLNLQTDQGHHKAKCSGDPEIYFELQMPHKPSSSDKALLEKCCDHLSVQAERSHIALDNTPELKTRGVQPPEPCLKGTCALWEWHEHSRATGSRIFPEYPRPRICQRSCKYHIGIWSHISVALAQFRYNVGQRLRDIYQGPPTSPLISRFHPCTKSDGSFRDNQPLWAARIDNFISSLCSVFRSKGRGDE